MRALLLAALIVLPALPARAAFEDLGAGARAAGMGNAFVPVADDVYAIYYNPAGLGTLERPELGAAYSMLYPGLSDSSNLNTAFIGYVHPLREGRQGALGAAWDSFTLDTSLYREDAFYLSYGRLMWEAPPGGELYGGVNLKYLRSSFGSFAEAANAVRTNGVVGSGQTDPLLAGSRSRSAYDGDLGLLYKLGRHYSVGLAALHLNQPDVSYGSGPDRLPMLLKMGFNYRSLISNLVAEYDTQRGSAGGRDHTFIMAAERWFPRLFAGDVAARAGFGWGSRDYTEFDAGASYRSRRFEIDYALGVPIGTVSVPISSHKISLSFRFGRRTEAEESLEMVLEAMKQLKAGQAGPPAEADRVPSRGLTVEEFLAQSRALEARARYFEALQKFDEALQTAPADKALLERYGRLSFVARQIKALPSYKTDPMQASLHLGLLAYFSGDNLEAVAKVSQALSLEPGWKELDAFLTQLESVTGIKRATFPAGEKPDHQAAVKLAQANAAIEDAEYEKAAQLSLEVLRVEPKSAAAWEDLGSAYFALKQYDDSVKAWEKAYEFEPNAAVRTAIKATIRSIRRAREHAPAVKPVRQAPPPPERPRLSPQERQRLFDAGTDDYAARRFEAAKKAFETILQADPGDVEAQNALRRVKEELP
ncbi:MAG: tetratricopeptide repeat protein [Elusimicrobia bacterium]|nr:tetratricopeptide repeat protein [Elusimicrobiota bacterium]